MFLITQKDVYEISCDKFGRDFERNGEKFGVTIRDEDGQVMTKVLVRFTGTLLATTPISEQDKCNYAMKKAAQVFKIGSKATETSISTDNFEHLRGRKTNVDIMYGELKVLIHRFFTKYPDPVLHKLSPGDLFISTDLDFWKIVNSLPYFKTRGIIEETSENEEEYILAPGGLDKLEALKPTAEAGIQTANRYFQLVPLSQKVERPFVFILMPLKEEEMQQKTYFDVIKPTIKREFNVTCIRADEETQPGVINNQIFTLIHEAKCIIAETTTRNLNVFYELGMAHAFNKDVFVFNRKGEQRLPFDIANIRAIFYENDDDLRKKIIDNLKDHLL